MTAATSFRLLPKIGRWIVCGLKSDRIFQGTSYAETREREILSYDSSRVTFWRIHHLIGACRLAGEGARPT
jgi:hypothetical protein